MSTFFEVLHQLWQSDMTSDRFYRQFLFPTNMENLNENMNEINLNSESIFVFKVKTIFRCRIFPDKIFSAVVVFACANVFS